MTKMLERRIKKARYLYSQGYSIKQISNIMLLDETTILKYLSNCFPKTHKDLIEKIEKAIYPFKLTEEKKEDIKKKLERFDLNICYESIDAGAKYYLKKDKEHITKDEVLKFLEKLPGIAYNKTNLK